MTFDDPDSLPTAGFDPMSAEFLSDPHAYYRRLREESPVAGIAGGFVLLSRYEDCFQVLRDPDWETPPTFGCVQTKASEDDPDFRSLRGLVGAGPDPGDEQRLARTVMVRTFTKQGSKYVTSAMADGANRLLDKAIEAGEVDLVESFTAPFITAVTCDLLGVPPEDHLAVQKWSEDLAGLLDPMYMQTPEETKLQARAGQELRDYITNLVVERRKHPGEDLLSTLIAAEESGQRLSDHELVTTSCIIAMGAMFPITSFLGMAVWSLLQNPSQLALLRENPSIARTAVEELLRYDPPVQFTMRSVPYDTTFAGHQVSKGRNVIALVASANRDPAVFDDPARLDLTRANTPHLTFGHGRYHCVGAMFARAEAKCALTTLLDRAPKIAATGEPELKQRFTMRGLVRLPVSLR